MLPQQALEWKCGATGRIGVKVNSTDQRIECRWIFSQPMFQRKLGLLLASKGVATQAAKDKDAKLPSKMGFREHLFKVGDHPQDRT